MLSLFRPSAFVVLGLLLGVALAGCGADPSGAGDVDGGAVDARPGDIDARGSEFDAGADADAASPSTDGGGEFDGGGGGLLDGGGSSLDAGGASSPDGGGGGLLDGGTPDAGGDITPDAGGGITTACSLGDGQALWRLTFPANQGGFATVEEWDNGCDYSLADQACSLSGEPHGYANFGPGILFNSSTDFFRVRYSVQGLSFSQATLYLTAHADGSGIPNAVLESPIYGSLSFAPTVPISTHRTYAVDWSDFLSPQDSPSLTAVTLRSNPTGLAVSAIELCVE